MLSLVIYTPHVAEVTVKSQKEDVRLDIGRAIK